MMLIAQSLLLGLAAAHQVKHVHPPRSNDAGYSTNSSCRVLPGDKDWPSTDQWNRLNDTIHGHLIASHPITSVCHDMPFNDFKAEECAVQQATWNQTLITHLDSPAEFFNMYWKNYTCDPFTPQSQPCELGNYPSYVINVQGAADVQAGFKFAKENNIRLVIKNTGHDYLGKSTGKGALSLWTHNLKGTQFISDYKSADYNGPAIKMGAGVVAYEAYASANSTGHRIVGGTCPTVGLAGGYSQGGGHSLLSTSYGLGADNVLEWEVVTVDGQHVVATPSNEYSDLYWAMSGGGPGTYAVAISMTARLHQDSMVGGASLSFNDTKVGSDAFWEAVEALYVLMPQFVDQGNAFGHSLSNHAFGTVAATMPGAHTIEEVNALMKPFLDDLTKRGIDYEYTPRVAPNYYDHFDHYLGPLPEGSTPYADFVSSRIIPRALIEDQSKRPTLMNVMKTAAQPEGYFDSLCVGLNVSAQANRYNSVNPIWRDAFLVCLYPGLWDPMASPAEMAARQDFASNKLQPLIDAGTPGGAVYMNEATYLQQNWQKEFFGTNYERLRSIKEKYDPQSLLWAHVTVGSEAWAEDANHRLCRT